MSCQRYLNLRLVGHNPAEQFLDVSNPAGQGIFLVDDSLTPALPSKTEILGSLQIRILNLRKRRKKSFPTVKTFLALKLCKFKVLNLPLMELVIFRGRNFFFYYRR